MSEISESVHIFLINTLYYISGDREKRIASFVIYYSS